MALILAIESSTTVCSVALADGPAILSMREENQGYNHASQLSPFIIQVLDEAGCMAKDLDAVAVSKGPGSYTGLRIGVSSAKGICFACNIPLIATSALEAMALEMSGQYPKGHLIVPVIDARRMEVYCAAYSTGMKEISPVKAKIIQPDSFDGYLLQFDTIVLGGDGVNKFSGLFQDNPALIIREDIHPSARWLIPLAQDAFERNAFEDLAYFEPFYVKEFIAGKPRVKGLF